MPECAAWLRPVYFGPLVPHIVLAPLVVPLALTTIHRAWRGRFDRHRRLARVTLPSPSRTGAAASAIRTPALLPLRLPLLSRPVRRGRRSPLLCPGIAVAEHGYVRVPARD